MTGKPDNHENEWAIALRIYREWASDPTPHDKMPDFEEWCEENIKSYQKMGTKDVE